MSKFSFLACSVLFLGLASCAMTKKIDDSQLAQLETNGEGFIVFTTDFSSSGAPIGYFENVDTGETYEVSIPRGWLKSKTPSARVPIGTYKLLSVEYFSGGDIIFDYSEPKNPKRRDIPLRNHWAYMHGDFKPFEVRSGEFTYIGSIVANTRKKTYTQGAKKSALGYVFSPFSDPNQRKISTYSAYDGSEVTKAQILKANPNIADRFVVRMIEPYPQEQQLQAEIQKLRDRDALRESLKTRKKQFKQFDAFVKENGDLEEVKVKGDRELVKAYWRERVKTLNAQHEFLTNYINRYGVDYVKDNKPAFYDEYRFLNLFFGPKIRE